MDLRRGLRISAVAMTPARATRTSGRPLWPLESEPKPVSVDGGVMAGVGVSETTVGVGVEAVVQASTVELPGATSGRRRP